MAPFNSLFNLAYQSGSLGYCFGDPKDHASTSAIPTAEKRREMADKGKEIIEQLVQRIGMPAVVEKMADLRAFEENVMEERPWMPAAYNRDPYNL